MKHQLNLRHHKISLLRHLISENSGLHFSPLSNLLLLQSVRTVGIGDYVMAMRPLFVKWLQEILYSMEEYKDFPYQIVLTHNDIYPDYYDLETGRFVEAQ